MTDTDRMVVWLREAMDAALRDAEAAAQETAPDWDPGTEHASYSVDEAKTGAAVVVGTYEYLDWGVRRHIALHDPAAVLRRIAADRKILDLHQNDAGKCTECGQGYELMDWGPDFPCATVRLLAEGWGWTEETTP